MVPLEYQILQVKKKGRLNPTQDFQNRLEKKVYDMKRPTVNVSLNVLQ